jgi:hypothetical protein
MFVEPVGHPSTAATATDATASYAIGNTTSPTRPGGNPRALCNYIGNPKNTT